MGCLERKVPRGSPVHYHDRVALTSTLNLYLLESTESEYERLRRRRTRGVCQILAMSLQATYCTARAIARSLQEVQGGVSKVASASSHDHEVIEIEDDDDDDVAVPKLPSVPQDDAEAQFEADLQRALAASQAEAAPKQSAPPPQEVSSPRASSSFIPDRAQLERERLARQKRLRPDIVHDAKGDSEDDDEEVGGDVRSAKRQRVSPSAFSAPRANVAFSSTSAAKSATTTRSNSASDASLFFDGELRQTANKHAESSKDTRPVFRLTEIIAPVCLVSWSAFDGLFR